MMKAVVVRKFGPPEVLVAEEVPEPRPADGQVVVDVAAIGVNFVETLVRRGAFARAVNQVPYVPGNEVGGVVAEVGPGVDPALVGRRVVTGAGGRGGYAERAVAAVAGGKRKLELARSLGADVAVDYRDSDWAEVVRREVGEDGLHVVFDSVGGDIGRKAFDLLAGGGRFAVFGSASGAATEATFAEILRKGVTVIGYGGARPWPYPEYPHELEAEALREAAAGRLKPTIGQRFPLERAAEAHAAVESRTTVGKTLLIP